MFYFISLSFKTCYLLFYHRDGFQHTDFHRHSDNKGPNLVVVRSKSGYLFGGFTPESWDGSEKYKDNSATFIFTLTNPHAIAPTKFNCKPEDRRAVGCHPHFGPRFGGGPDIYVASNSHQNTDSFIDFPTTFIDTTGKGRSLFTGGKNFTTTDVEVYAVV